MLDFKSMFRLCHFKNTSAYTFLHCRNTSRSKQHFIEHWAPSHLSSNVLWFLSPISRWYFEPRNMNNISRRSPSVCTIIFDKVIIEIPSRACYYNLADSLEPSRIWLSAVPFFREVRPDRLLMRFVLFLDKIVEWFQTLYLLLNLCFDNVIL